MAKKHKFSHTITTHHGDGSHTVHHVHENSKFQPPAPQEGDVTSAAGSHDEMVDRMMDNLSEPHDGEDRDVSNKPYESPVKVGAKKAPVTVGGGAPSMRI